MAKQYQLDDSGLVVDEELSYDRELQPHLGHLEFDNEGFTAFDFDNLDANDDPSRLYSKVQSNRTGSEVNVTPDKGQGQGNTSSVIKQNDRPVDNGTVTISATSTPANQNGNVAVQFSNQNDSATTTTAASTGDSKINGTHNTDRRVIQTANLGNEPLRWRDMERQRPLRQRHIMLLKIFGIIACFFFLPTGIPAVYYAYKTEKEFEEGIIRGNIDEAQRCSRKSERFIIFSGLLAILTAVIVFAVVERSLIDDKNYWDSHSNSRILPP